VRDGGASFAILGPLTVTVDGVVTPLPAEKHRVLLGALLLRANAVVSRAELIDFLWSGDPPARARGALQTYVARLRQALRPLDRIVTHGDGYSITVTPAELDRWVFDDLVARAAKARTERDAASEAELLHRALALWQGPALADVSSERLREVAVSPLEERRLQTWERRIEVGLTLGQHATLVPVLRTLTAENSLRERFWELLMLALYGAGRQAEALETFRNVRRTLRDDLGIEPGERLQQIHRDVLAGTPALPPAGRAEAGPARGWRAAHQLPLDIGTLTGRDTAINEIAAAVVGDASKSPVPIVAVCGQPGVGKTAVAVRVAHTVRYRFPDGQWYLRLGGGPGGRSSADLLEEMLGLAGVDSAQIPADLDGRSALLRSRLAGRGVLLVLDDAVSAEQVRPLLPGAAGSAVLITSQADLRSLALSDAKIVRLDVLAEDDAVRLLTEVLAGQCEIDARELPVLAALCGHLPLALRLAAANLVGHSRAEVTGYLADLSSGDRLARLAVAGDGRAAVSATFDLSYRALPSPVRRLFALLGLLPGEDFTVPVAAALLGADLDAASASLTHLATVHLVQQSQPGRYRFHSLVRLYAAEQAARDDLARDGDQAVHRALDDALRRVDAAAAVLYPDLVRLPRPPAPTEAAPFTDAGQAREYLAAEQKNLEALIGFAAQARTELRPYAWHLADALRGHFHARGAVGPWRTAAEAGLRAATRAGDPAARAAMSMSLGLSYWTLGRHDEALSMLGAALADSRAAVQTAFEGALLSNLGVIHLEVGSPRQAIELFRRGLDVAQATDHKFIEGTVLMNLAGAHLAAGDILVAQAYAEEALLTCDKIDSPVASAAARSNLGQAYAALGRLDEAVALLTTALGAFRHLGSAVDVIEVLGHLAIVHRDRGDHPTALRIAAEALDLSRAGDVPRALGDSLIAVADVHAGTGNHDLSAGYYRRALDVLGTDARRHGVSRALSGLAVALRHRGDAEGAVGHAEAAVSGAALSGRRVEHARALVALGLAELVLGRPSAASRLAEALAIQHQIGHRAGAAETERLLASAEAPARHT
jgi:DNA-binding SARP family transcriptional activator/tetratricopeptide (TPR) repeat protein